MINIVENYLPLKDSRYTHSYFKNNNILISEKVLFVEEEKCYWNDDPILVGVNTIYNERFSEFTDSFHFFIDEHIEGTLFTLSGICVSKEEIKIEINSYDYDECWKSCVYNPKMLLKRILDLFTENISYKINEDQQFLLDVCCSENINGFEYLGEFISLFITRLVQIQKQVELEFSGFRWVEDYEKDEQLFSIEVVAKLLRSMDFKKISYNHGQKEYGRDFIFSELDKFGNFIHYGMQVKGEILMGEMWVRWMN